MRIIQITDLHINTSSEPVNGVDTRANFVRTLTEAEKLQADMLVLSGDLSFHSGDKEVYFWIKKQLDYKGIKNYKIIGGNHDDINVLAQVFDLTENVKDDELYFFIEPNFIFLDTARGYCSNRQLDWFKKEIVSIEGLNPVIFMHHPPFKAGVPHMDNNYAFQQPDIFKEICQMSNKLPYIFCGHYHNEISLINDGIKVFITPSTYLQIGMNSVEFEIDHIVPGFRVIDINNNKIKTTVRYVFD
ncbi:MAG: metallophosphoesterase [Saprospiraceae bacterium]|nr:metallophosphoesterase [Saprospiraceae bacterium]